MAKPAVYIIESESPNAFATGRSPKHAAVAATRGILSILDRDELKAVMGHELSHVGNRDTLIMTVVAVMAGAHLSIVNPLAGQSLSRLFSTHPPTQERARRLRGMRATGGGPF